MTALRIFALLSFTAGFCLPAFSQDPELPAEEVDIIKDFDARLTTTERLNLDPQLPPLDTSSRRLEYQDFAQTIDVEYLPPKIRPLSMRSGDVKESFDNYFKVGAGLPASFYLDGYYHITGSENYKVGLFGDYHTADNNRKVENQRFSTAHIGAEATVDLDRGFSVDGGIGYLSDVVHFYGYNDLNEAINEDFSFEKEQVRQRVGIFEGTSRIYNNTPTEADFNYEAGLDFYFLNDNYSVRERGFDLLLKGTKWFDATHPLTIELETDFTSYNDTATQSLNNFFLRPSYTHQLDVVKIKAGVTLASSDDNYYIFPDIEVAAPVLGEFLIAYVGAGGTLEKNNFRRLFDYNPFISSRIEVNNTRVYNYFGGIRGTVFGVIYNIEAEYKTVDDLALFLLPDVYDTIPRFDVLYDSGNIATLKASGMVTLLENLTVTGVFSQSIFSLDDQEKPWHLPTTTLNITGRYAALDDQFFLKGELFFQNGVPFLNDDGDAENLNALFDVSLGADYFFTKNIGAFLQLNNLANNKRQRWQRYPTLGFNFLVGLTARF